ncbi:histone-lysine n-methyltransferase setmar [Lasius niger]|uniref:Histone-lysine n-methyltransferase setmar n=1 Tax=Lasius niger TaxID=67767 RepID=A0A0J7JXT3_LASNI|nr:histone-lysine n-methyltransferase setmar [Lasius niger]
MKTSQRTYSKIIVSYLKNIPRGLEGTYPTVRPDVRFFMGNTPASGIQPRFAPCDVHIFGELKKHMRGPRFHSDEEVQHAVREWFLQEPIILYARGI